MPVSFPPSFFYETLNKQFKCPSFFLFLLSMENGLLFIISVRFNKYIQSDFGLIEVSMFLFKFPV